MACENLERSINEEAMKRETMENETKDLQTQVIIYDTFVSFF